ncbi:hypothetical protein JL2886_01720 [Phaeobacter gallaeciensis]|uniref:Uncharacterized protein n=1 Tax=Phaeobacter gallaeciensis TaxID=60890 RepID=A0A1B0ZRB4_9RHOB|nr:hypothetical protein JL2886_01720 [Phaeobacter gallaeciensis]
MFGCEIEVIELKKYSADIEMPDGGIASSLQAAFEEIQSA